MLPHIRTHLATHTVSGSEAGEGEVCRGGECESSSRRETDGLTDTNASEERGGQREGRSEG